MKKSSVARRYAKALFELVDSTGISSTRAALTALGDALTSSTELQHAMASPAFGLSEKIAVITALGQKVGAPATALNFLCQLVKTNRVALLADIAASFGELADQAKGTQQVEVVSARPLDAAAQEGLKTQLQATLRRDVDIAVRVDPALVAGLQIRLGSTVIDSSLRNRFNTMQARLMRE